MKTEKTNFQKQAFHFQKQAYDKMEMISKKKLQAWEDVQEEASKLIALPNTKQQFDSLLDSPLQYVKQKLDDIHRPNFNKLPISQDKLLDLLEINLAPLEIAVSKLKEYKAKLSFTVGSGVGYVINKEDYTMYTENENQNKELKLVQEWIEATYAMLGSSLDASGAYALARVSQKILYGNGKVIPSYYYINDLK